ncbi:hypothetical protein AVEN_62637-1 [Araneus ventricosus]|uniref:Uncharacterized protein n=1 Tax=Araneus ventricosus TaxID=182803 RepID=A0A4Y2H6A1_ARAVE|nr:hypothetical protein AVEN_62637-1 [Araneus ventricosus]
METSGTRALIDLRYREEILDSYIKTYAGDTGEEFKLMSYKARLTDLDFSRNIFRIMVRRELTSQLNIWSLVRYSIFGTGVEDRWLLQVSFLSRSTSLNKLFSMNGTHFGARKLN